MDPNARGRSPSAGQAGSHLRYTPSASPHPPYPKHNSFDNPQNSHNNHHNGNSSFSADQFAGLNPNLAQSQQYIDPSFTQDYQSQAQYSLNTQPYPDFQEQQSQQNTDIANNTFLQSAQGAHTGFDWNRSASSSNHVSPGAFSQHTSPTGETSSFPPFDFSQSNFDNQSGFDQNGSLDPALLADIDPNGLDLLQPQPPQPQQLDSALDPMAATTMQPHSPTPPHLFGRRHSGSPSPHASPNMHSAQFQSMNRPRNTSETLDPSSAAYPQGQGSEWGGMYRGHRRSPSDQLSDISSAHNSPYMQTLDFDANSHSSPMLNASSDPAFNDGLGLGGFSLNDSSSQQSFHSPGHSPHISPSLMPQQSALPPYTADNNYGLNQFNQQQNNMDMFQGAGQEPFPSLSQGNSPGDLGAADQMSPPEISIHYAPPAQKNAEAPRPPHAEDTLSPPLRAPSRNRMRAKSDTFIPARPPTPASGRGRSPSLQPQASSDSLSPFSPHTSSRSSSPANVGRGRNSSLGSRGRSSSGASDQRDYILDLANPERTPSSDPSNRRQQKHPATFQCTLCPKRFTRAYNLRSHLRTHTDERPFVCTVCGKAFARQHDRKRHEGLHSGEKKFVCRGNLQSGSQWGCGRRFARADALGRHFRSEAGRVCIKPLLDEEAAERQKAWMEEQVQAQVAAGLVAPQPMLQQPQVDLMRDFLPAALLQQYPALAGLDWNAIPQGPPPDEVDEVGGFSGRSSFEASSGGELFEDASEGEMGYPGQNSGMAGGMGQMGGAYGMQQQSGGYGNQAGDYMNGFEGR